MRLRKLERKEHELTRPLWEEVFPEDTPQFLDYYYTYKATENEIYVIEEQGEIRAMLHLNPYQMQVGERVELVHYIVAVATKQEYRHRGYMRQLLETALEEMYQAGEPFTFLMPAAEEIYTSFDFVTVYKQQLYHVPKPQKWKKSLEEQGYTFVKAISADCDDIARFVTARLKRRYSVYSIRNTSYYKTLLQEQKCQKGGIMLLKKEGKLVGCYLYAKEEGYEIREPIIDKKYERKLMEGMVPKKCHKIMIRILCAENLGSGLESIFLNEIV